MTPLERYRAEVAQAVLEPDPVQANTMLHLEDLYHSLTSSRQAPGGVFRWLREKLRPTQTAPVPGLYLWGGVGRGKTLLVDLFYDCLPFTQKKRTHFHRFMRKVHEELRQLRERQDPLSLVGQRFASQHRILCLDEFFVNDIGDAMILSGLLKSLHQHGVTLVSTSNVAPDDLYKNGLQRDRFVPAIEWLKSSNRIVHVDGSLDYRLQFLDNAQTYFTPLGSAARDGLAHNFSHVATEPGRPGVSLEIEGRDIPTERHADGVVWFDFNIICGGHRSQNDYLEIARCFHTVLIGDVPVLDPQSDDAARRFVHLVDVFYDRNVKLILSAAAPPDRLYQGKRLGQDFQRTASRLVEMQSHDYLARAHLP